MNQFQRVLNSRIFTVVILILIGVFSLSLIQVTLERMAYDEEVEILRNKIKEAEENQQHLERSVSFLSDKSFLERQARIKYNLKYSGEEVAFIYPSDAKIESAISSDLENSSNLIKWWRYLWGY